MSLADYPALIFIFAALIFVMKMTNTNTNHKNRSQLSRAFNWDVIAYDIGVLGRVGF